MSIENGFFNLCYLFFSIDVPVATTLGMNEFPVDSHFEFPGHPRCGFMSQFQTSELLIQLSRELLNTTVVSSSTTVYNVKFDIFNIGLGYVGLFRAAFVSHRIVDQFR
uniref:Uncharacterized protein n=1 Tax=Amorphochlora amoebiformis TaxID=1561963 RepID=A0A7S0DU20_9EUKA